MNTAQASDANVVRRDQFFPPAFAPVLDESFDVRIGLDMQSQNVARHLIKSLDEVIKFIGSERELDRLQIGEAQIA